MQFSTWWFKARADFCIESSVVAVAVKPFFLLVFETICKSVFPLQNTFECRVNKHDGWTEPRPGRTGRAAAGPARLRSPFVGNPVCGASSLPPLTPRGQTPPWLGNPRVSAQAPGGAAPRPYLRGQPAVPERPVRAACGAPQLALPVEHPVPQRAPVLGAHRQRVIAESFHPGRDGEGGGWQPRAPGSHQPSATPALSPWPICNARDSPALPVPPWPPTCTLRTPLCPPSPRAPPRPFPHPSPPPAPGTPRAPSRCPRVPRGARPHLPRMTPPRYRSPTSSMAAPTARPGHRGNGPALAPPPPWSRLSAAARARCGAGAEGAQGEPPCPGCCGCPRSRSSMCRR